MATQTIEFPASTGRTLTAVVYPVGSDTASATASSTTESTNRKGVYTGTFSSLSGNYLLVAEDGSSVPACIDPLVGVTNTAATFQTLSIRATTPQTGDVYSFLTTALTESYRSVGTTGTLAQLIYEILAGILDHSISSSTKTINKIDGTTAKTYTLNSATAPTSITEAT